MNVMESTVNTSASRELQHTETDEGQTYQRDVNCDHTGLSSLDDLHCYERLEHVR